MAANEVRVQAEGSIRVVQASGFSGAWATASGAASKLLAFSEGLKITYNMPEYEWQRDRGVLSHPKRKTDGGPYVFEAQCKVVNTGTLVNAISHGIGGLGTASGASVIKAHLEYKSLINEDATLTAIYYQGHHCVLVSHEFEESEEGNTYTLRWECQSAVFATASGYLS